MLFGFVASVERNDFRFAFFEIDSKAVLVEVIVDGGNVFGDAGVELGVSAAVGEEDYVVYPGKVGRRRKLKERCFGCGVFDVKEEVVGDAGVDVFLDVGAKMEHDKVKKEVGHWHSSTRTLSCMYGGVVVLILEMCVGVEFMHEMLEWMWEGRHEVG